MGGREGANGEKKARKASRERPRKRKERRA